MGNGGTETWSSLPRVPSSAGNGREGCGHSLQLLGCSASAQPYSQVPACTGCWSTGEDVYVKDALFCQTGGTVDSRTPRLCVTLRENIAHQALPQCLVTALGPLGLVVTSISPGALVISPAFSCTAWPAPGRPLAYIVLQNRARSSLQAHKVPGCCFVRK